MEEGKGVLEEEKMDFVHFSCLAFFPVFFFKKKSLTVLSAGKKSDLRPFFPQFLCTPLFSSAFVCGNLTFAKLAKEG